jgi:hypothetical protein
MACVWVLQADLVNETPLGSPTSETPVPSGLSTSVVPMKLPFWIASGETGLTSVTDQSGVSLTTATPPSRVSTVSTLPSRLELKRPAGSASAAPLAKVSFTMAL